VCCSALQCVVVFAVCYSVLQCVADPTCPFHFASGAHQICIHCVYVYVAVCCSMLQCVAVSCSVFQYVAV